MKICGVPLSHLPAGDGSRMRGS